MVILIEDIDIWSDTISGSRILSALKSCRDATNLSPESSGRLVVVGTGGTLISKFVRDSAQAFYGAALISLTSGKEAESGWKIS